MPETSFRGSLAAVLAAVCALVNCETAKCNALLIRGGKAATEAVVEAMERVSGRALSPIARKALSEELIAASGRWGDDVIRAAGKGGVELAEAAAKYGDDVWRLAARHPGAARRLALHADELMPLIRNVGPRVLELESKHPGLALRTVSEFGEEAGARILRTAPPEDIPRLVGLARRADSEATKTLLFEKYVESGGRILKNLDWKLVMAGGLSASALIAANNVSAGVRGAMEKSPDTLPKTAEVMARELAWPIPYALAALLAGLVSATLFKLYRWSKASGEKKKRSKRGVAR